MNGSLRFGGKICASLGPWKRSVPHILYMRTAKAQKVQIFTRRRLFAGRVLDVLRKTPHIRTMTDAKTQRGIVLSTEDFLQKLPERGAVLGIDVGSTRLGLAISNPSRNLASPRPSLIRTKWTEDAPKLATLLAAENICGIILGKPLTLKGEHGRAVDAVLSFADLFHQNFHLPATLWDERLTTVAAEKTLFQARQGRQKRMSKKDSKNFVDSAAAVLILQGFLDHVNPTDYGLR